MKKKLFSLATLCTLFSSAITAVNLCVRQENGEVAKFDVAHINEVNFDEAEDPSVVDISETPLKFSPHFTTGTIYQPKIRTASLIYDESYRALESVVVPSKVRIDGTIYHIQDISNKAFQSCSKLKSIEIPEGVRSIGSQAFDGCKNLESINIPASVKSLGNSLFVNCAKLTSLSIPENITYIPQSFCDGCTNLKEVVLPETVTTFYAYAFRGCSSLTNINIPQNTTTINEKVFFGCVGLEPGLLIFDNGVKCYGWIGDPAKCTEVVIPEGIKWIQSNAFENCSNLTKIEIPMGVTMIDYSAFFDCKSLTEIVIPETVWYIGDAAFFSCKNLEVTINNNQSNMTIGSLALNDCKSVTYTK